VPLLEKAVRLDPRGVDARFDLAAAYERNGNFDRAVAAFESLLVLDPNHAASLNYLGYILADKGIRLAEALQMVQKALSLKPESGPYIDSLGWIYFRLGRLDDARTEIERALQYEHEDPVIYEHLGDIYYGLGQQESAVKLWEKSITIDPDNTKVKEKIQKCGSGH
jgi:Flp pilus assembly protein TadD